MSTTMKTVIEQFFGAIFSQGQLALIEQTTNPNYHLHLPGGPDVQGQEALRQFVTMYRTAFPDLHFTLEDQVVEGDKIVTRWTVQGTQHGSLLGIPPTGKKVKVTGITISRMEDGKMTEVWVNWDMLGVLQQIGVVPAPGKEGSSLDHNL